MVIGEAGNLSAYAFAPAILVTPLGAFSVLTGAILGSYFLQEELGLLGKIGSTICLEGALIIVLHAPPNEDIQTIDQVLTSATQPSELWIMCFLLAKGSLTKLIRLSSLHHCRYHLDDRHDPHICTTLWEDEPLGLPLHMCCCRFGLSHVH